VVVGGCLVGFCYFFVWIQSPPPPMGGDPPWKVLQSGGRRSELSDKLISGCFSQTFKRPYLGLKGLTKLQKVLISSMGPYQAFQGLLEP